MEKSFLVLFLFISWKKHQESYIPKEPKQLSITSKCKQSKNDFFGKLKKLNAFSKSFQAPNAWAFHKTESSAK